MLFKVAALAMVLCALSLTLKKDQPAFAFLVSVGGALCLLALTAQKLLGLLDWVRSLAALTQTQSVSCLLTVLGIAVVSQFAADLCRESGLYAAATLVELCGRVLAMLQMLPLLQSLLDVFSFCLS